MSRRRLEQAIQLGKALDDEEEGGFVYSSVEDLASHDFGDTRDGVFSVQFSHDGEKLAVGCGDGSISIIKPSTGELIREVLPHKYMGLAITCLRFNPRDRRLFYAASSKGLVYSCSASDGSCTELIQEYHNEINCLDFSSDGKYFVTGGKDLNVRVYDNATCKLVKTYAGYNQINPHDDVQCVGHAQRIFAIKFHPEIDHVFLSGGWDNHLKVWDVRTSDGVQRTIGGPHICGDALDIRRDQILTGSWVMNGALQLWSLSEGKLEKTLTFPHGDDGEFLYGAAFCEHGAVIAGGSGTNSVQAINYKINQALGEIKLTKPATALCYSPGGRMFAVGGGDSSVKIAQLC